MEKITAKAKGYGWAVFLLVLVLMLNLAIPVFAQTTTLTTTVPDAYPLRLEIQGEGQVAVNDVIYDRSTDISAPRNTAIEITLYPKEGYYINSIIYNGKKITANSNNSVTLQNITEESSLKIEFSPNSSAPTTGDSSQLLLYLTMLVCSGVALILLYFLRKRYVVN